MKALPKILDSSIKRSLDSVMPEPEPVWVKSKWKAEELDKQRIESRLRVNPSLDVACGFGEIWAHPHPQMDDCVSIEIVVEQRVSRWRVRQTVFPLPQKLADCIALHPDQKIARFQLVMS